MTNNNIGRSTNLWTSDYVEEPPPPFGRSKSIYYNSSKISSGAGSSDMKTGYSVRCIMDDEISISNTIKSEEVIVYPIPASNKLYLKGTNTDFTSIIIYDLNGKIVLKETKNLDYLDIYHLHDGFYVIKIYSLDKVLTLKFIKIWNFSIYSP